MTQGRSARFLCALASLVALTRPGLAGGPAGVVPCLSIRHAIMPPVTTPGAPGDGILSPLKLISVVPANLASLQADLFAFGDQLVTGTWLPAVAGEYGVLSSGVNVHVTGESIPVPSSGTFTEAQARSYIDHQIAGRPAAAHANGNLYVLYLPQGLKVQDPGASGNSHHRAFQGSSFHDAYAAIQPDKTTLDAHTLTASHEIVEAATDTGPGFALHNDTALAQNLQTVWLTANGNLHVEVADLCSGTRIRVGPFLYQRSFSNQAASGEPCAPRNATKGWFNTTPVIGTAGIVQGATTFVGWYKVPAGKHSVDIDVRGWVSGTLPEHCSQRWKISANPIDTDKPSGFRPTQATLSAHTLGNGGRVTLHVEIPNPPPPGANWGAVRVKSSPMVDDPDADDFHVQVFGVFLH
jgi:hypothetical protein